MRVIFIQGFMDTNSVEGERFGSAEQKIQVTIDLSRSDQKFTTAFNDQ